jgi:hypothetical protein
MGVLLVSGLLALERFLARHSIAYRHARADILRNEHDIAGLYLRLHGIAASLRRAASIPE